MKKEMEQTIDQIIEAHSKYFSLRTKFECLLNENSDSIKNNGINAKMLADFFYFELSIIEKSEESNDEKLRFHETLKALVMSSASIRD